jgi:hypothetical protein
MYSVEKRWDNEAILARFVWRRDLLHRRVCAHHCKQQEQFVYYFMLQGTAEYSSTQYSSSSVYFSVGFA